MKSAPFEYVRPQNLHDVCQLLSDSAIDSRVIAGGQTLVPLMAMRLARPERLVDITHVDELADIVETEDTIRIGACVRQRSAERSPVIHQHLPLLSKALPNVGHQQTRNRGTIGGSICNADPTAEIVLTAVTLGATLNLQSINGPRSVCVTDFLVDAMETSIADNECLVSIDFPKTRTKNSGCGFVEVNARASDYAIVAAAVSLTLDERHEKCTHISACIGGASSVPVMTAETQNSLLGSELTDQEIEAAVSHAARQLTPMDDVHASGMYRKRVAAELLARAIREARDDCRSDRHAH